MILTPCNHCRMVHGCAKRTNILQTIQGLGLTSVRFKCSTLNESLQPGMICRVRVRYAWDGKTYSAEDGSPKMASVIMTGFVLKYDDKLRKVLLHVPREDDGFGLYSLTKGIWLSVLAAWPKAIQSTKDYRASICPACSWPKGLPRAADAWACPLKCNLEEAPDGTEQ